MKEQKKPMGCLDAFIYFVVGLFIVVFLMFYLLTNYENSEKEKLSSMSESEKQQYYKDIEKRKASDRLYYCQTAAHSLIRESIKNSLKDPQSFKEVGRNYYTNAIEIKYTATNGFGGRVTEAYRYHYEPDVCGTNSKVEKIN